MQRIYEWMEAHQDAEWDKRGVVATVIFVVFLIANATWASVPSVLLMVPAVVMVLAVALSPTVNRLVNR